jgi:hypothetical protein
MARQSSAFSVRELGVGVNRLSIGWMGLSLLALGLTLASAGSSAWADPGEGVDAPAAGATAGETGEAPDSAPDSAPGSAPVVSTTSATSSDSSTTVSTTTSVTTHVEIDPNFLLLPAYDLEMEKTSTGMKVGDSVNVKLDSGAKEGDAKLPKDLKVQVPPGTENADDLGFTFNQPNSPNGKDVNLTVTAVKSGHILIPSLEITDASGKPIARTNPISLDVATSIAATDPKPKEAEPPKPPVSLGFPLATLVALGILALLLLAALVYWLVQWSKKRRLNAPVGPLAPPKPEDEVALAALAQLEKKGLLKAGNFKAHYFAVSEIVKHYIGSRFRFDAAESTTDEMISHLEQHKGLPGDTLDTLREMFERLDRVKFTDYTPIPFEGTQLLEDAKKFVTFTKRPPQIVTPGETKVGAGVTQ